MRKDLESTNNYVYRPTSLDEIAYSINEDKIDLAQYLKLSNQSAKLVSILFTGNVSNCH